MTEQETFELIFTINDTYPKAYARFSHQDLKNLVAIWYKLLEELRRGVTNSQNSGADCADPGRHPAHQRRFTAARRKVRRLYLVGSGNVSSCPEQVKYPTLILLLRVPIEGITTALAHFPAVPVIVDDFP